jgi:hypothetical protein
MLRSRRRNQKLREEESNSNGGERHQQEPDTRTAIIMLKRSARSFVDKPYRDLTDVELTVLTVLRALTHRT